MKSTENDQINKLLNSIYSGNITETFNKSSIEAKVAILYALISGFHLTENPLYMDIAENLVEDHFKKNPAPVRLIPDDKTQTKSAFFAGVLLYIYENTRNKKYLNWAKIEMDYLLSSETKYMKFHGHLSYWKGKSELYAETSYLVYPFVIKIASLQNDIMQMSKFINQFMSLLHQLRDNKTGLYYSVFKESYFGHSLQRFPYFSSISNAYIIASIIEILSIIKDMVGGQSFSGLEKSLGKLYRDLAENLLKYQDLDTGLFRFKLTPLIKKAEMNKKEAENSTGKKFVKEIDYGSNKVRNDKANYDIPSSFLILDAIAKGFLYNYFDETIKKILLDSYEKMQKLIEKNKNPMQFEFKIQEPDYKFKYNYTLEDMRAIAICNYLSLNITINKIKGLPS